jgi:hypothetical protein
MQCSARRMDIMVWNAARPCQRYALLLCNPLPCRAFPTLLLYSQFCRQLSNLTAQTHLTAWLLRIATLHQSPTLRPHCFFASNHSFSRLAP